MKYHGNLFPRKKPFHVILKMGHQEGKYLLRNLRINATEIFVPLQNFLVTIRYKKFINIRHTSQSLDCLY